MFFVQISSLVTLQLLTQVGHDDQLDAPKYKCAVSLDFIQAISRYLRTCTDSVWFYDQIEKVAALIEGLGVHLLVQLTVQ